MRVFHVKHSGECVPAPPARFAPPRCLERPGGDASRVLFESTLFSPLTALRPSLSSRDPTSRLALCSAPRPSPPLRAVAPPLAGGAPPPPRAAPGPAPPPPAPPEPAFLLRPPPLPGFPRYDVSRETFVCFLLSPPSPVPLSLTALPACPASLSQPSLSPLGRSSACLPAPSSCAPFVCVPSPCPTLSRAPPRLAPSRSRPLSVLPHTFLMITRGLLNLLPRYSLG